VATEVKLPRLGQGMESGTIVRWLKSEGEHVEKGEPLFEVDTDKATQEVEAEASGVLLKIAVAEGEVPVGRTIAVIGDEGEDVAVDGQDSDGASAGTQAEAEPEEPQQESQPAPAEPEPVAAAEERGRGNGRIKASPLARRIAHERGIELTSVRGTGPEGRIVAEDVERAATTTTPTAPVATPRVAPGEVESVPLTNVRRTIARRLTEAWTVPAFQLTIDVEMTRANELVAKQRAANADVHVTVGDVLTKLTAAALVRHRELNARFAGDAVELFPTVNMGIAVAAPQGLVVPVIAASEQRTIAEIATVRAELVERTRANKLKVEDLDGGTFTISNLGMYSIRQFIAVLNPPQAAILAVGSTEDRVVAVDGTPSVRPMLTLTLTCDHRAVDGAIGAEFLRTLKAYLEEPGLAL
jgi:pyruvate dehydrogenase E2 component (dihydrolipoyllysine-residue acetyltransferase)